MKQLIMAFGLFFFQLTANPVVVVIDNSVRWIESDTHCRQDVWNQNLDMSSQCYIARRAQNLRNGSTGALDIVQSCIKDGYCNLDTINNVLEAFGGLKIDDIHNVSLEQEEQVKKALEALTDKLIVVKPLGIQKEVLDERGHFTESSLKSFLSQLKINGKFASFDNEECLNVKNIMDSKGAQTLQLFAIEVTCADTKQKYILKEVLHPQVEILGLEKAMIASELLPFIMPNHKDGYPELSLPLAYYSYIDSKNKAHYLTLMPMVLGKSLSSFVKHAVQNPQDKNAEDELKKAYYLAGNQMSRMHQYFMHNDPAGAVKRTISHGDAHFDNIFIDIDSNQTYWIDNERIARSLISPQDIMVDMQFLIHMSNNMILRTPEYRAINMNTFIDSILKAFIQGYIDAYPAHQQLELVSYIDAGLKENRTKENLDVVNQYHRYKDAIENVITRIKASFKDPITSAPLDLIPSALTAINGPILYNKPDVQK